VYAVYVLDYLPSLYAHATKELHPRGTKSTKTKHPLIIVI
jgi:hypothetical protein